MKKTLTIFSIIICTTTFGQSYSTFYGTYDVNQNVNIKKDVNVSGTVNQNVNKTVTTIDYGALAAANAQKEANRLDAMQYTDSRDAIRAKEIAADPFAAYKYGTASGGPYNRLLTRKYFSKYGHAGKKVKLTFTTPSQLLFTVTHANTFRNTTSDGSVLCEIELNVPSSYPYLQSKYGKEEFPDYTYLAKGVAEKMDKDSKVGEVMELDGEDYFTHKTEISRATVYGVKGYRFTWIYETDYEYVIKDNYYSDQNGIYFSSGIRYTVEKSRGTFEDLEGRRYYLRRLGEEIIATASFRYW